MFKSFLSKLWAPHKADSHSDPTEYLIVTKTKRYQGLIVHQNSQIISFCDSRKKHIKILKSNILTIAIVGNLGGDGPKVKSYHY